MSALFHIDFCSQHIPLLYSHALRPDLWENEQRHTQTRIPAFAVRSCDGGMEGGMSIQILSLWLWLLVNEPHRNLEDYSRHHASGVVISRQSPNVSPDASCAQVQNYLPPLDSNNITYYIFIITSRCRNRCDRTTHCAAPTTTHNLRATAARQTAHHSALNHRPACDTPLAAGIGDCNLGETW
jgi:hypothetical protein